MKCADCQHAVRGFTGRIYVLLSPKYRRQEDKLSDQSWQLIKAWLVKIDEQVASKNETQHAD